MLSKNRKIAYGVILTGLIAAFILASPRAALRELLVAQEAYYRGEFTITTYYPAPFGRYQEIETRGNTYLATEGGAVGIGTTSLGAKLDVVGGFIRTGAGSGNSIVLQGDNPNVGWQIFNNAVEGYAGTNGLAFYKYGTEGSAAGSKIVINTDGNVGIGTTGPTAELEVRKASGEANIRVSSGSGTGITEIANNGTSGWLQNTLGDFNIYDASSERLTVEQGGNVGIGTTGPDDKLDIQDGNIRLTKSNAGTVWVQSVDDNGAYNVNLGLNAGNVNASNSPTLLFAVGGAEKMRITSGGNVGIGVTNPASKLNVGGSGNSDYAIYGLSTTGTSPTGVCGSGTSKGVYGVTTAANGYGVYGINGSGTTGTWGAGVYGFGSSFDFLAPIGNAPEYGTTSSIRWKENIKPIDNPIGKILGLRGVYFDLKKEYGGGHGIGMIAEEVGKVLPEIVSYEEDGSGYAIGMDYGKLTPLLVEAVKAQQKEIEELKMRLSELEAKCSPNGK